MRPEAPQSILGAGRRKGGRCSLPGELDGLEAPDSHGARLAGRRLAFGFRAGQIGRVRRGLTTAPTPGEDGLRGYWQAWRSPRAGHAGATMRAARAG